jgi:hypothetical protein
MAEKTPLNVLSDGSARTLASCLEIVGCGDQFDLIIDDVTAEVSYWQFEYGLRKAQRLHHRMLKRELRKIAKAKTTTEAVDLWIESHTDTQTACTLAAWQLDGIGGDNTLMAQASHSLANINSGMATGRPSKVWRAPMVYCFDNLWIKAVGRDNHPVNEHTPRLEWLTELVYCVEGFRLDARHLERLHGAPFRFAPAWYLPPRAFELHSPQSRQA